MRQSAGKRVVMRSSVAPLKKAQAARKRLLRGNWAARIGESPPFGSAPGETWSVLSFRLSLKMHLTRSELQAAWAAPMGEV